MEDSEKSITFAVAKMYWKSIKNDIKMYWKSIKNDIKTYWKGLQVSDFLQFFWGDRLTGKRPRCNRASAKKTALIEAGIYI